MNADLWREANPSRKAWAVPAVSALAGLMVALIGTGWFFLYRPTGQIVDQLALLGARSYHEHSSTRVMAVGYDVISRASALIVQLVDLGATVVIVTLIIVLALWRRNWWLGISALVVFAGANLTTQAIKAWWERPDLGLYETYGNSWPSGHTTVAAATVYAVLLLTPPRWRWASASIAAVASILMAWGTVIHGWHRPSDTVAAMLVAAIWYVLVETIRRAVVPVPFEGKLHYRATTRVYDVLAGISAAVGLGILAAVALTLPDLPVHQIDVAVQRLAFMGALLGIVAASIGVSRILLIVGPCEDEPRN